MARSRKLEVTKLTQGTKTMKERLTLTLAWYAFLHAATIVSFFLAAIVLTALGIDGTGWAGSVIEATAWYPKAYSAIFGELTAQAMLGASPAIWLGLWITTGRPRTLPWKA
jgi:hypothetical protein